VHDGRVDHVEGAKDHPITRGGLCGKVRAYQERTYASDRLLYPLRRTGKKGSGQFERVGWDEALTTISTRFAEIIAGDGPEALMPLSYLGSMGVVQCRALMRLFHALGTTQLHGNICGASAAVLSDEGQPIGFDPEDFVDSRLIVLWGANVLTTCHHQWHFMKEARRLHGTRIICIDPRRTRTAEHCDQHIPIRPGTDAILAAGVARTMLEEGLADLDFARQAASDLETYCDQVSEWTPNRVAAVCGIEPAVVVALARELGQARPAVIRCGVGPQQNIQGEAFVRSLSALAVLGGHWRLRGGGLFVETWPVMHEDRAAGSNLTAGRPRSLDMAALGHTLTDERLDPPIKGLMVWNMNPAVVLPNTGQVWRGLAREGLFTVVLEHFMTDTARFADIVLPSTTQLEHFDVQGAWGHHYISVNNPAIAPLGETKSHGEVMRLVAERLGLTHPALQASDEDIAASALPSEVKLADLKVEGWKKCSPPRPTLDSNRKKLSLTGEPMTPPPQRAADMLQLLTPKSHYFLNSSFANMPRQRKAQGAPRLEMNPDDAATRGLVDGQRVVLKNELGKLHTALHVTDRVCLGVVALSGKWWSRPTETDAVTNLLVQSVLSPGGQPAFNDTFVQVESAG
jgi:anaerobic selenocysteine-containing dehydrogenase